MLARHIWLDKGFCNGSMGVVEDIIYKEDQYPPAPPLHVVIEFKDYNGPNFLRFYKTSDLIVPLISQA